MNKRQRQVLGALLVYGENTADIIHKIVNTDKDLVCGILKGFYKTGICDRRSHSGSFVYKISENWIDEVHQCYWF